MTRFRHSQHFAVFITVHLFLIAFIALPVAGQSDAESVLTPGATFVVNTTADTQDAAPGDGICADSGALCSLRAAITEANAFAGSDTITLPAGTYTESLVAANENANAGGDYDITSSITINGAAAASTFIQASATVGTATERVFHVLSGTVTISGVTIQNGVNLFAHAIGGGGVRVEGAATVFTLSNSTLTNNRSESRGGGLHTNKANVTITNCDFNNNQAGSAVAGTSGAGGGITIDSEDNVAVLGQSATITNALINNNKAESLVTNTFGGGMYVRALGANVNLTGCTINNNLSNALNASFSGFAGGLYNQQATTTLTNTTVSGNTSTHFHSAVRNLSLTSGPSTLNLVNTTVSNNTSSAADAQGGGVTNVVAGSFAATVNIDRSTISGNILAGNLSVGGGIINTGGPGAAAMNLINSTVSGNGAQDAAGVYSDGAAATCTINFSTIASNAANATAGVGGGVYQDSTSGGTTTIRNSISADNTASASVDVNDLVTSGNYNHIENPDTGFTPSANDTTGALSLGPLANNGGPTQTHLPVAPVIDAIPNGTNGCGTTVAIDQRNITRPSGGGCEKGSVEVSGATPTATSTGTPTFTATATNTSTPTATATNTSTPSSTATFTPTNTATNTPTGTTTNTPTGTATNTATPTPTVVQTPSIGGTVIYGNALAPPVFISNVTVTGTGAPNVTTTTAAPGPSAGQYTLTGFGAGAYTVSLSKTAGQNGLSSNDAARIAQHVIGVNVFTTDIQRVTADVSDNGTISSNDAALIARYVASAGPPIGITGTWRFFVPPGPTYPAGSSPTTRDYASVTGNLTGQDFIGILMGDITGNWNNTGARQAKTVGPERNVNVSLPQLVTETGKDIVIPVTVEGMANKGVISYEFDLRYDPNVIQPLADCVDISGTVSGGLSVVVNTDRPGVLRVVVYGPMPIDHDGVLLDLRFTAVGASGSVSPLVWESITFNEGDPAATVMNGQVELSQ